MADDSGEECKWISDLAERHPGEDEEPLYDDVDVSELPDWWREAIKEHEQFDLRPYRPPRFSDGRVAPPVLEDLRRRLDIDLKIMGMNVDYQEEWSVVIDDVEAFKVGRRRLPEGYTQFDIKCSRFIDRVEEHLRDRSE